MHGRRGGRVLSILLRCGVGGRRAEKIELKRRKERSGKRWKSTMLTWQTRPLPAPVYSSATGGKDGKEDRRRSFAPSHHREKTRTTDLFRQEDGQTQLFAQRKDCPSYAEPLATTTKTTNTNEEEENDHNERKRGKEGGEIILLFCEEAGETGSVRDERGHRRGGRSVWGWRKRSGD